MQILRGFGGHTLNRGGGTVIVQGDGSIDITPKGGEIVSVSGDMSVLNSFGLVIGHPSQVSIGGLQAELQVLGTDASDSTISIGRWSADLNEPSLRFYKSRNETIGSNTAVTTGDNLGIILAYGDDGTDDDTLSSAIVFDTEGTISTGQVPGIIRFQVAAAGTLADAMIIDSSKNIEMASTLGVGVAPSSAIAVFAVIDSNNKVAFFKNTHSSGPAGITVQYSAAAPNGVGNLFLTCFDSGATRLDIRSNGGIANFQSNDADLSDSRLKTRYDRVESTWEQTKAIEIWNYRYTENLDSRMMRGAMAQQVGGISPHLFDEKGWGDGIHHTLFNKDLWFDNMRTLQEAQFRIETSEEKIERLEEQITELIAA